MKKVLVVVSIVLNVLLLGWFVFDEVLGKDLGDIFQGKIDRIEDASDSYDADLKKIEEKYGVTQEQVEEAAEAIIECSQNFVCMMAVQFVYANGLIESMNEFEGDIFACKSKYSPITIFSPEDQSDEAFSCVKFTKKYKGFSIEALQSDVDEDLLKYEKVGG